MLRRYKNDYYAYRCVECGKFISKEQFMKCARCEKCNGGKEELLKELNK